MKKNVVLALVAATIVSYFFVSCSNSGDAPFIPINLPSGGRDNTAPTRGEGENPTPSGGEEPTTARGEAECRSDMYQAKRLLDIPKAAISGEGSERIYCDLPLSVQGFKEVSIRWSSDNSKLAIDDELAVLSPVNSCQTATLTAKLSCGGYTDSKTFSIKLYPKGDTSLTAENYLEAAKFALCFGKQRRDNAFGYSFFKELMSGFGSTDITISDMTTNGNSVDISAPTGTWQNTRQWSCGIHVSPVNKTVKITAEFKRGSTTSSRVYYLQAKLIDTTEFYAENPGLITNVTYAKYKFENGFLICEPKYDYLPKTMCKYEISETDNTMTLSAVKKYYNGKWQTKDEWLSENSGSYEFDAQRRAGFEFFQNRKFTYLTGNSSGNKYLELKSTWDSSVNWSLQFGLFSESPGPGASFFLPIKTDHISSTRDKNNASFAPLKNSVGTFNSAYTTFTAYDVTYNISCQEKSGGHSLTFASTTESYTFSYGSLSLAEISWEK